MAMRASLRAFGPLRNAQLGVGLTVNGARTSSMQKSLFHTSRVSLLVVGEKIPPHNLMESGPTDRVDLQKEIGSKKSLIIGVPAAFSGTCTESHLPGFFSQLDQLRQKGIKDIYVISANDPFVMNAWKKSFGADPSIRFLADPQAGWVKAARLDWDGTSIFGGHRSKRFVAVVEDGVVSAIFIEPDNTGLTITSAASVLPSI